MSVMARAVACNRPRSRRRAGVDTGLDNPHLKSCGLVLLEPAFSNVPNIQEFSRLLKISREKFTAPRGRSMAGSTRRQEPGEGFSARRVTRFKSNAVHLARTGEQFGKPRCSAGVLTGVFRRWGQRRYRKSVSAHDVFTLTEQYWV